MDDQHVTLFQTDVSVHGLPQIVSATFCLYFIVTLGDSIDLDRARQLLSAPVTRRSIPTRVRHAGSIQIASGTLDVELGQVQVSLAGAEFQGSLRVGVYEMGVAAFVLQLPLAVAPTWSQVANLFAAAQDAPPSVRACYSAAQDDLVMLLYSAIKQPSASTLSEEYSLLVVHELQPADEAASLGNRPDIRAALLGEQRPVAAEALDLVTGMSYYEDDVVLLSWNGAIIVEQDRLAVEAIGSLLEIAYIERLFLRVYEDELEGDLGRVYDQMLRARRRINVPLVGRYNRLLRDTQQAVMDITEITERVANAFKVTDDVYWNRLYSAALTVLRVSIWRSAVEHRINLLRESYGMLHSQADSDRSASLELIIILLILFEIVYAFVVK